MGKRGTPSNFIDLAGKVFGRLTVIQRAQNDSCGNVRWLCRCECGNERIVPKSNLTRGRAQSCGCLHSERAAAANTKHGNAPNRNVSSEYHTWRCMRQRCLNPNATGFENYGGRGIVVCARWEHSFENFLADMGPKPSRGYSIERKDVNGNYEPGNCVWADNNMQSQNKRPRKDSSSGIRGVMWFKRDQNWQAQIRVKGKPIHLGYFETIEDAAEARRLAEDKYWQKSSG